MDEQAARAYWERMAPTYGLPAGATVTARAETPREDVYLIEGAGGESVRCEMRVRRLELHLMGTKSADEEPSARQTDVIALQAGESGIGPRVLWMDRMVDEFGGRSVTVVNALEGRTPDRDWFLSYRTQATVIMARLHRSAEIRDMLKAQGRGSPEDDCMALVREAVGAARRGLGILPADLGAEARTFIAWAESELKDAESAFTGKEPVPTNGDTTAENWVVTGDNRAYLLEWDAARIDDPARDLAPVMIPHFPPVLWPVVVRGYARWQDPNLLTRCRFRYVLDTVARMASDFGAPGADEAKLRVNYEGALGILRRFRAGAL